MKNNTITIFWMLLLFVLVQPSYQVVYPCDPTMTCGCSSRPVGTSRIVGGETAGRATWGWAVSLAIDGDLRCGGSILSDSWILTAAHCLNDISASQLTIFAGSNRPLSGTQNRTVSQVIMHPNYDFETSENDIALLKLSSPFDMSDSVVSSICLPIVSSETLRAGEWPEVSRTVIAVGWGQLSEDGVFPQNLQQVTLETVDYRAPTCDAVIYDQQVQLCASVPNGDKGYYFSLLVFCSDTCKGDSGGPLMMFTSSDQWVLVGLTSNGIGCGRASSSGVYTRVAAFQEWIKSHTSDSYWISNDGSILTVRSLANSSLDFVHSLTRVVLSTLVAFWKRTRSQITIHSHASNVSIRTSYIFLGIVLLLSFM